MTLVGSMCEDTQGEIMEEHMETHDGGFDLVLSPFIRVLQCYFIFY